MLTFRHFGDLGDIIYALPVIKAMKGGVLMIEASTMARQYLTRDKWCGIDILLKAQPYIQDVIEWDGRRPNVNLNDFRARLFPSVSRGMDIDKALVDWILDTHQVPRSAKDEAWLNVEPLPLRRVIFNRTGPGRAPMYVYQNPEFPWHYVWEKYHKDAAFIGSPLEYEVFCAVCGEVPYIETANLYEAARVIAGADLFVGNQSVCHAIAEGLKKRIVLEVWKQGPNCLHFREGVIHGHDRHIALPDL